MLIQLFLIFGHYHDNLTAHGTMILPETLIMPCAAAEGIINVTAISISKNSHRVLQFTVSILQFIESVLQFIESIVQFILSVLLFKESILQFIVSVLLKNLNCIFTTWLRIHSVPTVETPLGLTTTF